MSSAFALSSGRTKDSVLAACAREMWFQAAASDHDIQFRHKPGLDIPLADALSRRYDDASKNAYALRVVESRNLSLCHPDLSDLLFLNVNN